MLSRLAAVLAGSLVGGLCRLAPRLVRTLSPLVRLFEDRPRLLLRVVAACRPLFRKQICATFYSLLIG